MNREFPRASTGAMLAYVDDCLPPAERAAFKQRMLDNPEINKQIDTWLFQNEAIRAAFPVPFHGRFPVAESETGGRSFSPEFASSGPRIVRDGGEFDRPPNAIARANVRPPQPEATALASARQAAPAWHAPVFARRALAVFVGVVAFWVAGVFPSSNSSVEFARAATAAYRTFADHAARPVEIATSDREILNKWFAPQILRPPAIPDLWAAGFILLGGRVAPGAFSSVQYILYENPQHERIALEIEAMDAPPRTNVEISQIGTLLCASWTGTGHSFAIVGRVSPARLGELARLVREDQQGN